MADNTQKENTSAAGLQRARNEDLQRQKGNEEQRALQEASETPSPLGQTSHHKIPVIQGLLMLVVALIMDGIEFLAAATIIAMPVNWIFWIFGSLGFFIWLAMLGVSWSDARGKRAWMILGGGSLIDFIGLGFLPAWTVFVIGQLINDRVEEVVSKVPGGDKLGLVKQKV